jgi:hypothetical protein
LFLLALAMAVAASMLRLRFMPVAEGALMTDFPFWGLTLGCLLVAADLLRFLLLWSRLKGLLHEIALVPMASRFNGLPEKVWSTFRGYLFPPRPRESHARLPAQQLGLLGLETQRLLDGPSGGDPDPERRAQLQRVANRITEFQVAEERVRQNLAATNGLRTLARTRARR